MWQEGIFFLLLFSSWSRCLQDGTTEGDRLFEHDWVQTYRLCTPQFAGWLFTEAVGGPAGGGRGDHQSIRLVFLIPPQYP